MALQTLEKRADELKFGNDSSCSTPPHQFDSVSNRSGLARKERIAIINPRKGLESELQDQQEIELMPRLISFTSQIVIRDLRDLRYMELEG